MPVRGPRLSTSVLLLCGAFAAIHMLLHLATVPVLTLLAPLSPPLYGLVAGVHGLMPFLARRFTATPGTATITAGIAGAFVALASPSGFLVLVPLLVAGVVIDAVVWRVDRGGRASLRYLLAAALAGVALFAVSLSVFSPEHLTPLLLVSTLGARIAGELIAVTLAGVLVRALKRAGVRRPTARMGANAPEPVDDPSVISLRMKEGDRQTGAR